MLALKDFNFYKPDKSSGICSILLLLTLKKTRLTSWDIYGGTILILFQLKSNYSKVSSLAMDGWRIDIAFWLRTAIYNEGNLWTICSRFCMLFSERFILLTFTQGDILASSLSEIYIFSSHTTVVYYFKIFSNSRGMKYPNATSISGLCINFGTSMIECVRINSFCSYTFLSCFKRFISPEIFSSNRHTESS